MLRLRLLIVILVISWSTASTAAPKLSPYVGKQLVKARTLMETESWSEAKGFLEQLSKTSTGKYTQALIAQSLGQVAIHQDNLVEALSQFNKAYQYEALGKKSRTQLLHSIGQLHCGVDEWVPCREKMAHWVKLAPEQAKANDFIMIAQAFSATEHWAEVIEPVQMALGKKAFAPINWHQLEVVAFANLGKWPQAIQAQNKLLRFYLDEAQEWRRLVSLHLQREDYQNALDSMRVPFEQGLLQKESDYRQMAQLQFYGELPFQAGRTLAVGVERGIVVENIDNLKLLGSFWIQAKEYERAIMVYMKLNEINKSRKWSKQLAMLHFQKKEWLKASTILKRAVDTRFEADLQLMLGVALINLKQFDQAKLALTPLEDHENLRERVENWLSYIKKVNA